MKTTIYFYSLLLFLLLGCELKPTRYNYHYDTNSQLARENPIAYFVGTSIGITILYFMNAHEAYQEELLHTSLRKSKRKISFFSFLKGVASSKITVKEYPHATAVFWGFGTSCGMLTFLGLKSINSTNEKQVRQWQQNECIRDDERNANFLKRLSQNIEEFQKQKQKEEEQLDTRRTFGPSTPIIDLRELSYPPEREEGFHQFSEEFLRFIQQVQDERMREQASRIESLAEALRKQAQARRDLEENRRTTSLRKQEQARKEQEQAQRTIALRGLETEQAQIEIEEARNSQKQELRELDLKDQELTRRDQELTLQENALKKALQEEEQKKQVLINNALKKQKKMEQDNEEEAPKCAICTNLLDEPGLARNEKKYFNCSHNHRTL